MQGKQLFRITLCGLAASVFSCLAASQPVGMPRAIASPAILAAATQSSPIIQPAAPIAKEVNSNAQVWNLKNADIRAVIQTVSVLTGKNFIIDPSVHGNVTLVSQKPMTPDEMYQVFLSMLQLMHYAAVSSGNITKIVPAMDANALSRQVATVTQPGVGDEVVVRVVPVNHVSATELVPVLRPLMTQSSSITAYLPSNALILAGDASNIQRLVEVIHQMDAVDTSQIHVVHLKHANAKKIVDIIHSLQSGTVSQGGVNNATIVADDDNNSILINANMANQMLMENLIHELDQKSASSDNTTVIRLNYLSAKKFAPILAKVATGMNASDAKSSGKTADTDDDSSTISVQAEENNNAVIIHAPKALLDGLVAVVHRLDVRPQEVLVEAVIVKVDENLLSKLGIVWGTSDGNASTSGTTTTASASLASDNTFALKANHGVGFLPDGNLIALLHALKTNGATDVLSTPSVVVLNNDKATISDGQNIGVADRSYQGASATTTGNPAQNSVTPFNQISRQDVALSLNVTPHISPNSMIRMELEQRDDTVAASNSDAGTDNPTLNISKIATSVLVKSGSILVLGGLMSHNQEKTVEKLPVLGSLPLIGHLFRYDSNTASKSSLMVFIRPVIMTGQNAQLQTMNRYSYIRHQEIDLATNGLKQVESKPLLPPLSKDPAATLPKPVSTIQLPLPNATTESVH